MFGKFFKKASSHANKFFGTTLPQAARDGHAFLNNTLLPGAQKAHRFIKAASDEISSSKDLSVKNQKRLEDFGKFADAGLSRVTSLHQTANGIATRLAT